MIMVGNSIGHTWVKQTNSNTIEMYWETYLRGEFSISGKGVRMGGGVVLLIISHFS